MIAGTVQEVCAGRRVSLGTMRCFFFLRRRIFFLDVR